MNMLTVVFGWRVSVFNAAQMDGWKYELDYTEAGDIVIKTPVHAPFVVKVAMGDLMTMDRYLAKTKAHLVAVTGTGHLYNAIDD